MVGKLIRRIQIRVIAALTLALSLLIVGSSSSRNFRRWIEPTVYAATFTVTTAADHDDGTCDASDCTLREAINAANASPGPDTISFNISPSFVPSTPISLTSALPTINSTINIDATTQPGFSGTPRIELIGTAAGASTNGLSFNGANCSVSGLIINRFSGYGINVDSFNGVTITGNYIGTNALGSAALGNGAGGIRVNIGGTTIGGTSANSGNVISGNTGNGIDIVSGSSTIQGNFIGTNAAGTSAVANTGAGININAAGGNTMGGTSAAARNVISGNGAEGILITNSPVADTIQGNYIGTSANGSARLGNQSNGVSISGSNGTIIGGSAAGAGNVLSGNVGANAYGIHTQTSSNTQIQGNLIGTNAAGTAKIQNDAGGIILLGGSNITVGGTSASARNTVSGNGGAGILILADATVVRGNYVGTNAAGTAALGNGSEGILINGADNAIIGGASAGAGNLISGNADTGILISGAADNNTVQGNLIGPDALGTGALGNGLGSAGVVIQNISINNTIGGTVAGAGNVIAFNDGGGVGVGDGSRNAILGNSIFSNRFGIDLAPSGVTANDGCDSDSGANLLQNFPVLTSVTAGAANTTVLGTLNSTASTTFRVEFFSSPSCSVLGSGEGKTFLGFQNVTTDGSCNANINFVAPNSSVIGSIVTATATDPNNNTSEFSACVLQKTANAVFQFSAANYTVGEDGGSVAITVNRSVETAGTSFVDFTTGNNQYRPCTPGDPQNITGMATQNCDFIRTQGTLTFNPGDTSKTFSVLIIDDAYVEGTETLPLTLSNPVGGTVGAIGAGTVTITDIEMPVINRFTPFRFAAVLNGSQETPPNNSNGSGLGLVLLVSNDLVPETQAKAGLVFSNLGSSVTGAHIHGPANPGVSAPILFPLPTTNPLVNFLINGVTPQQDTDLRNGLHYMNVHTSNFPNGEIRGQLLWNPTLEGDFLVNQQYYDFLQRIPDVGGFGFWSGKVRACEADVQCFHDQTIGVSNAFFYEQEYQKTGAYVYRLFRAAFGNLQPLPNGDGSNPTEANKIPSYDAYASLRARVIGGADLTAGQQDAASLFVNSPQFLARYPANQPMDQFVDAILGTILTDIGVNLTAQRLTLIGLPNRATVLYRLANDDSVQNNGGFDNHLFIDAEYNRAFVVTQYFGYLRRDGDIGGILFWLGQVNSAPLRNVPKQNAMVCSFITSGEYQLRFGPKAPRTNNECQ